VEGLSIPLHLAPGEHVLSVRFLYASHATRDTEKLSFSTLESDEPLAERHIEMPSFSFTPPSTGAYNTALDATFGGDLIGLLVYSTTIPTASSDVATVREVRLYVGGSIVFEGTIDDLRSDGNYPADSTLRSITDNYLYLDFSKAPIEAGARIELQIKSDDTNEIEILPVLEV